MKPRRTIPRILLRAHELRANITEAEALLWQTLRMHQLAGVHFRRQHAIGPYIVDFCAPRAKLIIEVDGGQHADQQDYDRERSAYLESKGYCVLRFWNSEVLQNREQVVVCILEKLK